MEKSKYKFSLLIVEALEYGEIARMIRDISNSKETQL
jgi:hypothetical protein